MKIYTKGSLIERLKEIKQMEWALSGREGNCGGVGNTLEDLLGIQENNLDDLINIYDEINIKRL